MEMKKNKTTELQKITVAPSGTVLATKLNYLKMQREERSLQKLALYSAPLSQVATYSPSSLKNTLQGLPPRSQTTNDGVFRHE